MKNIAKTIVLLALLQPVVSRAQQPETYFDTIYVPYPLFDWDAWRMQGNNNRIVHYSEITYPFSGSEMIGDVVQYCYVEDTGGIEIWGLEAPYSTYGISRYDVVPTNPPQYLLLYDARPDTFELKAKVLLTPTDDRSSILHFNGYDPINNNWDSCPPVYSIPTPYDLPLRRYIFDQPIHIYDSFYVGVTKRSDAYIPGLSDSIPEPWWTELGVVPGEFLTRIWTFAMSSAGRRPADTALDCVPPLFRWKLFQWGHSDGYPIFEWTDTYSLQSLMVYPLVRKITEVQLPACTDVEEFRISGRMGAVTEFQWVSDGLHNEWELSYGIEGTPPDSGTVLSLTEPRYWLNDNAYPDTPMVAYIRTVCREQDILRHGRWSAGIHWDGHLIHQGIPAEGIGAYVELLPNPAKGMTVVSSSYRLTRIRAYNMQGQLVLDQRPSLSQSATLDLSAWHKGTYLLRINTLAGIVSKKLLVE